MDACAQPRPQPHYRDRGIQINKCNKPRRCLGLGRDFIDRTCNVVDRKVIWISAHAVRRRLQIDHIARPTFTVRFARQCTKASARNGTDTLAAPTVARAPTTALASSLSPSPTAQGARAQRPSEGGAAAGGTRSGVSAGVVPCGPGAAGRPAAARGGAWAAAGRPAAARGGASTDGAAVRRQTNTVASCPPQLIGSSRSWLQRLESGSQQPSTAARNGVSMTHRPPGRRTRAASRTSDA
eukprot:4456097-Prymnesium_polylepis.1